jgi:hypothetical protein
VQSERVWGVPNKKPGNAGFFYSSSKKEESPEHGKYELLLISEILSLTLSGLLMIN